MADVEILARIPWFRTGGLLAGLFALGIAGMMAADPWSWGSLACGVPALLLGYAALAGLLNHSRILLREGMLEVRAFPIPWRVVRVPVGELTGLEVQASAPGPDDSVTWELRALCRTGPPLRLCAGPRGGTTHADLQAVRLSVCARLKLAP